MRNGLRFALLKRSRAVSSASTLNAMHTASERASLPLAAGLGGVVSRSQSIAGGLALKKAIHAAAMRGLRVCEFLSMHDDVRELQSSILVARSVGVLVI